jgi:hypothetical protein
VPPAELFRICLYLRFYGLPFIHAYYWPLRNELPSGEVMRNPWCQVTKNNLDPFRRVHLARISRKRILFDRFSTCRKAKFKMKTKFHVSWRKSSWSVWSMWNQGRLSSVDQKSHHITTSSLFPSNCSCPIVSWIEFNQVLVPALSPADHSSDHFLCYLFNQRASQKNTKASTSIKKSEIQTRVEWETVSS